jgi:hypothetical protein
MTTPAKPKSPPPWAPVIIPINDPRLGAIKALASGTATPGQQQLAWESILFDFCGIRDLSWRPDEGGGARATDFAEGRRFVGLQLVKNSQLHVVQSKIRGEGPDAYPVGPEPAEHKSTTG